MYVSKHNQPTSKQASKLVSNRSKHSKHSKHANMQDSTHASMQAQQARKRSQSAQQTQKAQQAIFFPLALLSGTHTGNTLPERSS